MAASQSETADTGPVTTDLASSERADAGRQRLVALGGILGAIAASSCCVIPLILFSLGIGGAWIGNLTALAPYKPLFVAGTAGALMAQPARVQSPAGSFSSRSGSRPCS